MFTFTNSDQTTPEEIIQILYPQLYRSNGKLPKNHTIGSPYRLVISGIRLDEDNNYFSNCFITPDVVLYNQANKDESLPLLKKATLHKHDFFEFMFVLSGEIYVNIENERHLYQEGSCYILNRNVMHTEEFNTDFSVVFLQISTAVMKLLYSELCLNFFNVEKNRETSDMREFIAGNLTSDCDTHKAYVDFIPRDGNKDIVKTLHDCFDHITHETLQPEIGSTITVMSLLKQLFLFMSLPDNFSTTPVQIGSDAEYSLFEEIVKEKEKSYGRISRSLLAKRLNYSGAYLNEICKKYSGLCLFDYGMTFCMKEAARRLRSSNDNITDIGFELGFTNRSHFYKLFKNAYGMTPAEYRRKNR